MSSLDLYHIALALGAVGFACFAWPIYQRMSGKAPAEAPGSGRSLRSPLWWAGFVLTIGAIFLLRISQRGAG
ncbi:hypothetical protein [Bosea lathyri]|uniref:Uncharacterized protein n=1 Tax=Bosea lathyri TaxID=1036778 RepID=A0A1H5XCG4_9HYPH|nr:hypothetical protein [Bosea lathyri]SEG09130.1 hypothetical protein SAMN04488115_103176 [Bosea lathyri]